MTKLIVILGFAVAFVAGLAIGMRKQAAIAPVQPPIEPTTPQTREARPRGGGPGWLSSELKLTTQQQEQMRQIWSDMASRGGRDHDDKRGKARRDRDEAIAALVARLPAEEKAAYEKIHRDYAEQNAALDKEMRSRFERAVERTKAMLTDEQKVKYEAIINRGPGPGPGPGWDRRGSPGTRENDRGQRGEPPPGSPKTRTHRPQDDERATSRPAAEQKPPIP